MKLGVLTVPLYGMSFKDACKYLADSGVQALEIGAGGCPGKGHCDPDILLNDAAKLEEFKAIIADNGLEIAALSTHGNGVHPNPEVAKRDNDDFFNTCRLAEKLGVKTVVTFSGCPGGSAQDKTPNWITCPWPTDFADSLVYQWNDVLIPDWQKTVKLAADYGVEKIALEMHPGFCVYNPETLLKLRNAVGPAIGANFDPSHLFWQGIDPIEGIRFLGGEAIHHFHAKDTKVDAYNTAKNGVLDNKHYSDVLHRSWSFRTIGYGHDQQVWKDIISTLRVVGYDGVISIEHEDSLMSVNEGLQKAIAFLKQVITFEGTAEMWWA